MERTGDKEEKQKTKGRRKMTVEGGEKYRSIGVKEKRTDIGEENAEEEPRRRRDGRGDERGKVKAEEMVNGNDEAKKEAA